MGTKPVNAQPRTCWFMTVDEYLAFEKQSDLRHEYVAGEVHAMVGASRRHGLIVMNIAARLWQALRGGPCETHTSDIKVQAARDIIYYPDIVVTCSDGEDDPFIIKHPTFIVEVLSPSTASTDRREKMIYYRNMPSMLCYLVVHQDERKLERHWRDATGDPWEFDLLLKSHNSRILIPSLDIELTFDEVYEGVQFDASS